MLSQVATHVLAAGSTTTIAGRLGYATQAEIQRLGTLTAEITRMLGASR